MGIYLNPGNENFKEVILNGKYVDKTMMIAYINKYIDIWDNCVCISRPRGFGKTIAANALSAYYSKGCDSRELFAPLKIASDPDFNDPKGRRNSQNVIKIDMESEYQSVFEKKNLMRNLTSEIISELRISFPNVVIRDEDTLAWAILKVYTATGATFIVIIDNYDVLVREKADKELFDEYLSFLNGLFKSDTVRPAISLAYLTGILPMFRDKNQSGLNNFDEYTILDAYTLSEYIGFTSDEVKLLCDVNGMNFEECKRWYDGYHQNGYEIYNPESVIKAMANKRFGSYWGKTSTYEAIAERIRQNFKGTKDDVIKMLAGESVPVNVTRYMNTMDSFSTRSDLFMYLIHLGYLAYNYEDQTCRIPNWEVRQEWYNAIEDNEDYDETNRIIKNSRQLLEDTIAGDEEAVARALDTTHIHVTSNRSYNNEDALQSAVYLAYIYALNEYTVIKELTTGKGFADMVYIPAKNCKVKHPAMIIELKKNKCVESAIDQIKKKEYFDGLSKYQGDLLFVGINYDETEKTHTCKIERFVK